ncbi:MAG: TonB-dependent receptor [Sphingomonas sp.]|uniref:TonB-dependent receptor domain-containing protein n=1 Tax=Sphingomonas TaxID=13687 RepID=UPI0011AB4E33|nr:TonB-dependent receptor [Sphingomonas sp.]
MSASPTTYTHLSPRIGATFDVVKGVALFAGYATAFRAPFGFIGTCRRCRRQRATSRAG